MTMFFAQYYLDCLSHASYLVGDPYSGEGFVVDPRRDIDEYLEDASDQGIEIKYVIETHFHADFLSGHLELASATGAEIIYADVANPEFPAKLVADGQRLSLGEVELQFIHTPGHTPESMCVVVWEDGDDDVPYGVFTGDTLFIGDVGRPDLLASIGVTADELATCLYDSLHNKLMKLPDETRVFPAHGAGSACGKNLSTEKQSTIGIQRATNYALAEMDIESFKELVTAGQPAAPDYFVHDAMLNREERELFDSSAPATIELSELNQLLAAGAAAVDIRPNEEFARGHITNSINIGAEGRFAEFAGSVVEPDTPIVLISNDEESALEAHMRLGRIGFDNVAGIIPNVREVLADNPDQVSISSRLTVADLKERLDNNKELAIIDIRNPSETDEGTIDGATCVPLSQLPSRLDELDLNKPLVVNCRGGYRSSIAASYLVSKGAADVSDLLGGYTAWAASGRS